MRRMQTIEKVIGENTFYIRPFGAFAAANISGELAALLSPILAHSLRFLVTRSNA